jgi:hypothetical protein
LIPIKEFKQQKLVFRRVKPVFGCRRHCYAVFFKKIATGSMENWKVRYYPDTIQIIVSLKASDSMDTSNAMIQVSAEGLRDDG